MKASEAVRIPELLAARRPPVTYEEATIEGVRMLVIIGNEVDTVIRFSRGGSADLPQVSTYPDVAESAVCADQKLLRQRASGRRNTTGEGNDWPVIGSWIKQRPQERSGMRTQGRSAWQQSPLARPLQGRISRTGYPVSNN